MRDEFRAGGRVPLIIGRALTGKARAPTWASGESDAFLKPEAINDPARATPWPRRWSARPAASTGVRPGMSVEPKMTTVGSQDTTGPMTADEMKELACLSFDADLVMQSFCHTAAYPKEVDVKMHRWLPEFIVERNGVALRPGDGIIHSWLNRMLLPDTVGTGGDSHTRFPIGISFPAGSGLVAFGAALGFMPLDMPGVGAGSLQGRDAARHHPARPGQRHPLLRDEGRPTDGRQGRQGQRLRRSHPGNRRSGDLTAEQAFELYPTPPPNAAPPPAPSICREDSRGRVPEEQHRAAEVMIEDGYGHKDTIQRRIDGMEAWLAKPKLMRADADAEYAYVLEIDLDDIVTEPIVACPNDPDKVATLSLLVDEAAGHFRALAKVDEVFVGELHDQHRSLP